MNIEEKLRASKPPVAEPPPYLHSRIMNSIKAPEAAKRSGVWRFSAALAIAAVTIGAIIILNRAPETQQVAIDLPSIPKVTVSAENSLQAEMENLKADTRNAARALAANFLPSQP